MFLGSCQLKYFGVEIEINKKRVNFIYFDIVGLGRRVSLFANLLG
jgi:hypothetical protein